MRNNVQDPLFRVSKRMSMPLGKRIAILAGSVVSALVIGMIFIAAIGYNPFSYIGMILTASFKSPINLKLLFYTFTPLLITSLGIALAFKMRFWNIGGEGQFLFGALMSTTIGLAIGNSLPKPLGVIVVLLAGAIGGGLFALIPALFRVKFNTNETLLTLMFNYIALYLVSYVSKTDFYAINLGTWSFRQLAQSLRLTSFGGGGFAMDAGLFIGIGLAILMFFYFRNTKQGYEIQVVGDSPATARYSGMRVGKIVLRTIFFSGMLIGLAGALKLTSAASNYTFSTNFTGGVGWTAIIIAWLCKLNPLAIALGALLMSMLERGSSVAQSSLGISSASADIIQGIILFGVLVGDFFIHYQVRFRKHAFSLPYFGSAPKEEISPENQRLLDEIRAEITAQDALRQSDSPSASDNTVIGGNAQ